MASYAGSKQPEADHDGLGDNIWSDILKEVDKSRAESDLCCGGDDPYQLLGFDDRSQSAASHVSQYIDSTHRAQHTDYCVMKPKNDSSDDEDDDDVHASYWRNAGRTLRTFLSQTSQTNLLFGNDDAHVIDGDIIHGQEPAACSSLPTSDLVLLEDDPHQSFIPLFGELRHKIHGLGDGRREELHPISQQKREKPKTKGQSKSSQLTTWSEFSSSEESDNPWFRLKPGRHHRRCYGGRRPTSDEKRLEGMWSRSCSEEPGYCSSNRLLFDHPSGGRKKRKKFTTEKTSSLNGDKLLSTATLPFQTSPTSNKTSLPRDRSSFTDCLADVESNATDSEDTGHITDDDNDYNNTAINSSAPLACSFHCIPSENSETQTTRFTVSDVDCSPVSSPVCDKDHHCVSSDGEFTEDLRNICLSDLESCHSSLSFGGNEEHIDMNELTYAAVSASALSAAAAAAAAAVADLDDDDDDGDGWKVCDVETRPEPREFCSSRNREMFTLDDRVDDDDDDGHNDDGDDDDELFRLPLDTDADNEFECDCPICLMHQQHISESWQDSGPERLLPITGTGADDRGHVNYMPAGYYDDEGDDNEEPVVSFTFNGPDYYSAVNDGVTLTSIFQDVVIQMLQYYPNLLTSQTSPPLTDAEFSHLPSLTISPATLGEETSCSICLCQFEDSEDAKVLPCRHMFHTLCIQAWLNKAGTCPVCRQSVVLNASAAEASRYDNDDNNDMAECA